MYIYVWVGDWGVGDGENYETCHSSTCDLLDLLLVACHRVSCQLQLAQLPQTSDADPLNYDIWDYEPPAPNHITIFHIPYSIVPRVSGLMTHRLTTPRLSTQHTTANDHWILDIGSEVSVSRGYPPARWRCLGTGRSAAAPPHCGRI